MKKPLKTADLMDIFDRYHHQSLDFFESLLPFEEENLEKFETAFDVHEEFLRQFMLEAVRAFTELRFKSADDQEATNLGFAVLIESLEAFSETQRKGEIIAEKIAKFKLKLKLHGTSPNG